MPQRRSSDSLRAVLLSAKSQSGSGSKPGSTALTWHSLKSAGPAGISDPPGHYFPAKIALAMGLVKLFFSILMMGLGAVAIVMKASISSIGAGVWVGVIVGVSGFLGVCAARRPYVHVYVISFMSVSILSLAASGLLIVLSATAWARDDTAHHLVIFDTETESEVDLFGEYLSQKPSILVSGLLVILGVFDILISLACVALSAREACGAPSSNMGVFTVNDGHDKKERLYRWLGQQKNIFQTSTSNGPKNISSVSQFVPLTPSGDTSPFRKHSSPPLSPSAEPLLQPIQKASQKHSPPPGKSGDSSGSSSDALNEKRGSKTSQVSKSSSGVPSGKKNSSVVLLHPKVDYALKEPFLVKKKHKGKAPSPPHQEPYSLPSLVPVNGHRTRHREGNIYGNHHWMQPHPQYVHLHPQDTYVQGNPHHGFQSLPAPHPHQFYAQHSSMYYPQVSPPMRSQYAAIENIPQSKTRRDFRKLQKEVRKKEKEKQKKKEEKRRRREERQKRRNAPLTDKQIDNSYTGLDREIAEGFITLTMQPAASKRRFQPASDKDSF